MVVVKLKSLSYVGRLEGYIGIEAARPNLGTADSKASIDKSCQVYL